ncbi:protein kinase subdomain-containing protein PKL CAK Fmp29 [Coprinopsis sp. MPI-PUGE-AT-0042]|nr:protein kinase subdomain-containing protein PKL CAK Fmp29 [Coprinopsis sp. MPI-PUGE-AT-0042]
MFRIAAKGSLELFSQLLPMHSLRQVAGTSTATCATGSKVFLRPLSVSSSPPLWKSAWSPRRSFSGLVSGDNELFNYTSGRWVYNESLRLEERRTPFNVDELMRLAAKSVGRRESDIIDFSKRAEGDHNRVFLITFKDSFQMIARIPYSITGPKYYTIASEVATMEYLRLSGLPVPLVYGYSPGEDNKAFKPYIFMEYIQGITVKDAWWFLADEDLGDIARQTAQLEAKMMALSFPAGGSLYFAKDLKKVGLKGVPLPGDDRFCIQVDTRVPLWFKKRAQLPAFRGPYHSVEEALVAGACKEIAFLEKFSAPAQPIRRERWPCYNFQPQQPSDHVRNLGRYLSITSSLLPNDPDQQRFCLRHPETKISNLLINTDCQIVGLVDWEHTSILPLFLVARHPDVSWHPEQENIQQESDDDQYRHRLMQYHYVKATEEYNKVHHRTFTDPLHSLRGRLFESASARWEGETLELHLSLLEAWNRWDELNSAAGAATPISPCPFEVSDAELFSAIDLAEEACDVERTFKSINAKAGIIGEAGWVPIQDYENAKMVLDEEKRRVMGEDERTEEQKQQIVGRWPWDDIDEEQLAK